MSSTGGVCELVVVRVLLRRRARGGREVGLEVGVVDKRVAIKGVDTVLVAIVVGVHETVLVREVGALDVRVNDEAGRAACVHACLATLCVDACFAASTTGSWRTGRGDRGRSGR